MFWKYVFMFSDSDFIGDVKKGNLMRGTVRLTSNLYLFYLFLHDRMENTDTKIKSKVTGDADELFQTFHFYYECYDYIMLRA